MVWHGLVGALCLLLASCLAAPPALGQWQMVPAGGAAPDPRSKCAVLIVRQPALGSGPHLLILGGQTPAESWTGDFRAFSVDRRRWRRVTPVSGPRPPAVRENRLAVLPDRPDQLLLLGGSTPAGTTAALWRFDFTALTWAPEPAPPLPARDRFCAVVLAGGWHVLLGLGASGGMLGDHWRLTNASAARRWLALESGPVARRSAGCATAGPTSFVVTGGITADNVQPSDLWRYTFDPATQSGVWEALLPTPKPAVGRIYSSVVAVGDAVYMGGGFDRVQGRYPADWWTIDTAAPETGWLPAPAREGVAPGYSNVYTSEDADLGDLYAFGGDRGVGTAINAVFRYSRADRAWETLFAGNNYTAPPARAYHSAVALAGQLLLIGFGQAAGGAHLNDLWTWAVRRQRWDRVAFKGKGVAPLPRRSAVLVADGSLVVVFGGIDATAAASDDLWHTNLFDHAYALEQGTPLPQCEWVSETPGPGAAWPAARYAAAAALRNATVVLYGGVTAEGTGLGDLWALDVSTWAWRALPSADAPPGRVLLSAATLTVPTARLAVFGGNMWDLFTLDLDTLRWRAYNTTDPDGEGVQSYQAVMLAGEGQLLALFGGIRRTFVRARNLFLLQHLDRAANVTTVEPTPDAALAARFGAAGATVGGTVMMFGGQLGQDTQTVPDGQLDELWGFQPPACPAGPIPAGVTCAPCAAGYIRPDPGADCAPCPAGSFASNGACVACPARTANPLPAGTSRKQCLPCPQGTYSPLEGQPGCRPCPAGAACPPYSAQPLKPGEVLQAGVRHEGPAPLRPTRLPAFAWVVAGLLGGGGALLLGLLYLGEARRQHFVRFDLFSTRHFVPDREPVRRVPTPRGGVFAALALTISLALICLLVFMFVWSDVATVEALQSEARSRNAVAGDVAVHITLLGSATCSARCAELAATAVGAARSDLRCYSSGKYDCTLELALSGFAMLDATAELNFLFEAEASARALLINVTTATGLEGTVDKYAVTVLPPAGKLFRGQAPTVVGLLVYSTVYFSLRGRSYTGHHLLHTGNQLGAVVDPKEFAYSSGLAVRVALEKAQASINVTRYRKGNVLGLLGQSAGIVSAVSGALALIMWLTESRKKPGRARSATPAVAAPAPAAPAPAFAEPGPLVVNPLPPQALVSTPNRPSTPACWEDLSGQREHWLLPEGRVVDQGQPRKVWIDGESVAGTSSEVELEPRKPAK